MRSLDIPLVAWLMQHLNQNDGLLAMPVGMITRNFPWWHGSSFLFPCYYGCSTSKCTKLNHCLGSITSGQMQAYVRLEHLYCEMFWNVRLEHMCIVKCFKMLSHCWHIWTGKILPLLFFQGFQIRCPYLPKYRLISISSKIGHSLGQFFFA